MPIRRLAGNPQPTVDPGLNLDEPDERAPATPRKRDRHALAPSLAGVGSRRILGMRVDGLRTSVAANGILELAEAGAGGVVCVATVHMVMEAFDAPRFQRSVNAADLVTPDGVPLVWALRELGLRETRRVYGPTLMQLVCRRAEERGLPIGLYGGSPEVLERLRERLVARHPLLRIAFAASPPFRPETDAGGREHRFRRSRPRARASSSWASAARSRSAGWRRTARRCPA